MMRRNYSTRKMRTADRIGIALAVQKMKDKLKGNKEARDEDEPNTDTTPPTPSTGAPTREPEDGKQ